jgi:CRP/FNR family transcriptional regulator, cyclic AMP receptor protein
LTGATQENVYARLGVMTVSSVAALLRQVALFSSLPDEKLSALACRSRTQRYRERQEILSVDDNSTDVFFILSGRIEVRSYSENGREFIFSTISAGEVFGEFAAIDGRPRSASVVALVDSLVCRMSSSEFLSVLNSNFDIALKLMRLLTAKLRTLTDRQLELVAVSSRGRVLSELARLANSGIKCGASITIQPAPTHYEIAARVGSQREAVTKELNRLEALGYLRVRRKHIVILDMARFRDDLLTVHCP